MIPPHFDIATASDAEKRMFELLRSDPAARDWVVLHSLGLVRRGRKPYGEIDFVVLIPAMGIFCLEVKGGRVACNGGVWSTVDRNGRPAEFKRSPFMQVRDGMFALRKSVTDRLPPDVASHLLFGCGVMMPDVTFREQSPEWETWQVIDHDTLRQSVSRAIMRLAARSRELHPTIGPKEPDAEKLRRVQQLLRPDFDIVVTCGVQIEDSETRLLRLTEEQFEAIDLLAGNERALFEGPAGTGKTVLALEHARRSAAAGRKTLLLCFNRLLGDWLARQTSGAVATRGLTAGSYHRLVRDVIMKSSLAGKFLTEEQSSSPERLYTDIYPPYGKSAITERKEKYDSIVVDEAQDLMKPEVLTVVDSWLEGSMREGRWAIFGDFLRQAIFSGTSADEMKACLRSFCPHFASGRLTWNCRNTRNIGEETALLSGFSSPPYRMNDVAGLPVDYFYYHSRKEQAQSVQAMIRRLLDGRVAPRDIVVLSKLRLEHSAAGEPGATDDVCIIDAANCPAGQPRRPFVRFATIQAFKGMESPVVILCDVEKVSGSEQLSLLYVGMSRARSLLAVLAHEQVKPDINENFRRKLLETWKGTP